jgi:hypothetical protein
MNESSRAVPVRIAVILAQVVVPLWALTGALFKLYERNPGDLPGVIRALAKSWQIDNLDHLLRTLIGLELFAAGVMLLVPRFARAMAIFMLTMFCAILIAEIQRQATKCGCFGKLPVKPWHMLAIDGTLLVGLIATVVLSARPMGWHALFPPRPTWAKSVFAAVLLLIAGLAAGFAVPQPPPTVQLAPAVEPAPLASNADPSVNPNPLPVPSSWYVKGDIKQWLGKSWRELELFQLMPKWPVNMNEGKHYVVFYKRDCEHCESMFYDHLIVPLDAPVTAVLIPHSKTSLMPPEGDAWKMPPTPCELLELPLGCNWIITPPLAMTFADGKLTCAVEGEGYETCLGVAKLH